MKINVMIKVLTPILLLLAVGSIAHAQATRTWVSGVGDDTNPCSRIAPCKTFAGAISKTAAGGEIDVLDPGGFGTFLINKAITIDGGGQVASVLASGTVGININAGPNDVVILRNLTINGAGTTLGTRGITYIAGGSVIVEHCNIMNFSESGINTNGLTTGGNLFVGDTTITNTGIGVQVTGSGNKNIVTSLRNVSIKTCATAIETSFGTLDVSNSILTQNTSVLANSGFGLHALGGSITSIGCTVTGNLIGIQAEPNGVIRLSNTEIYNNLTGIAISGGTIYSAGNNHKGGSAPATTPTPLTTF